MEATKEETKKQTENRQIESRIFCLAGWFDAQSHGTTNEGWRLINKSESTQT